jgi:hypothetical protein
VEFSGKQTFELFRRRADALRFFYCHGADIGINNRSK